MISCGGLLGCLCFGQAAFAVPSRLLLGQTQGLFTPFRTSSSMLAPVRWAAATPGELTAADQLLLQAALRGEREQIQAALAQGARLEARDPRLDLTPLMLALYRDHPDAFQDLLAAGANVNARNPRGQTPLMMLASGGQLTLVQAVIQAGGAINARDELGNTALMWAAYWGHHHVVEYLLQAGAEARGANDDGNTALHLAATGGLANHTRKLLQKPSYTSTGRRVLATPITDGALALFQTLLKAGTPLDAVNRWGQTALLLTAEKGAWPPLHYLIQSGADLNVQDREGRGLADYLTEAGHPEWMERLP